MAGFCLAEQAAGGRAQVSEGMSSDDLAPKEAQVVGSRRRRGARGSGSPRAAPARKKQRTSSASREASPPKKKQKTFGRQAQQVRKHNNNFNYKRKAVVLGTWCVGVWCEGTGRVWVGVS